MKDPSSFELRDAWYESDDRKKIILYTSGKNGFGGTTSSLDLYYFRDNEYQLFASIDDMEDEESSIFDDEEDLMEKLFNNLARVAIRKMRIDSNKVDKEVIDRINDLNKEGIIKDIKLLDDVKNIYPPKIDDDDDLEDGYGL